jgi:hypothetical protein
MFYVSAEIGLALQRCGKGKIFLQQGAEHDILT